MYHITTQHKCKHKQHLSHCLRMKKNDRHNSMKMMIKHNDLQKKKKYGNRSK